MRRLCHTKLETCDTRAFSRRGASVVDKSTQDPSDTTLLLSDLVDKSLVKVVEQNYYLHDLVLDFAKDELMKLRGKVQLVTSRQAQYLGTISVLEGYARAGEVLRG
ncbi:unnamed protein product, partial [Scytosiphon promiscuus]